MPLHAHNCGQAKGLTCNPEIRRHDKELQKQHPEPKEYKEEVHAAGRVTKAVRITHRLPELIHLQIAKDAHSNRGHVARLDQKHAQINEDEGEVDECKESPVFCPAPRGRVKRCQDFEWYQPTARAAQTNRTTASSPSERLDGETNRKEGGAHNDRNQNSSLL
jgi:hypothetical protein|eukprot:7386906-Prymnesium_polylepis.2